MLVADEDWSRNLCDIAYFPEPTLSPPKRTYGDCDITLWSVFVNATVLMCVCGFHVLMFRYALSPEIAYSFKETRLLLCYML